MRAQAGILGFCWIDTAAVDGGPTPTMTVRERCLWVRPKGRLVLLDRLASRHSNLTAGTRSLRNFGDFAAKKVLGNLGEIANGRNIIDDRAAGLPGNWGHRRRNYQRASGAAHAKLPGSFRLPWPE